MISNHMENNYVDRIQNIEKTFYQMNTSGGPYNTNLKNNKDKDSFSLFSKINSSIMIPEHPHPLFSCLIQERSKKSPSWSCNNCGCNYLNSVPSFYCTACDYDMCQKCLLQHPLYKINYYNYKQNQKFELNIDKTNNNYRPDIHEHLMALIKFDIQNPGNEFIKCKKCKGPILINEEFYYCSLCNFYVCQKCFNPLNFDPKKINPNFNDGAQNEGRPGA